MAPARSEGAVVVQKNLRSLLYDQLYEPVPLSLNVITSVVIRGSESDG